MRADTTLLVSFQGSQVAVHSGEPEIVQGVRGLFPSMLDAQTRNVVAELVVARSGDRYGLFEFGADLVVGNSLANILEHLSFVITDRLIAAHPKLLWLHAAAAQHRARIVVIAGPWGSGKTALATGLTDLGWTLLSDDLVPIDPATEEIHAFPRTPFVRPDPGRHLSREELRDVLKVETGSLPVLGRSDVRALSAFLFPTFKRDASSRVLSCSPAEAALELLKQCRNFDEHKDAAVTYMGRLAAHAPAFRLTYGDAREGARCVDELIRSQPTEAAS